MKNCQFPVDLNFIVFSVSGGELFEKIMEDESLMSEEEVRDYMHQILLGVQHMHNNSIVHLDLKVN